jgi:hypothetical protein
MSTFNSIAIIEEMIRNNGRDVGPFEPGERPDPDVAMIVEYTNAWGATCWGVTWVVEQPEAQRRYLQASDYVINPRLLWQRGEK